MRDSIENKIITSTKTPIEIKHNVTTNVFGRQGLWVNKDEVESWRGPKPITDYVLNQDPCPELIRNKLDSSPIEYYQDISVKYLKPPGPNSPQGDLVIKQKDDILISPAPAHIVRILAAPRPPTPPPVFIREQPPKKPLHFEATEIVIEGKEVGPAPRRVITEFMPQQPAKPPQVFIEKWLPYEKQTRRVVFHPGKQEPVPKCIKNVEIHWELPDVVTKRQITDLNLVEQVNPDEYRKQYGDTLMATNQMPQFTSDWNYVSKLPVATDDLRNELKRVNNVGASSSGSSTSNDLIGPIMFSDEYPELVGDVHALNLLDLNKHGLSYYAKYGYGSNNHNNNITSTITSTITNKIADNNDNNNQQNSSTSFAKILINKIVGQSEDKQQPKSSSETYSNILIVGSKQIQESHTVHHGSTTSRSSSLTSTTSSPNIRDIVQEIHSHGTHLAHRDSDTSSLSEQHGNNKKYQY